jgi:hypothetical protein
MWNKNLLDSICPTVWQAKKVTQRLIANLQLILPVALKSLTTQTNAFPQEV